MSLLLLGFELCSAGVAAASCGAAALEAVLDALGDAAAAAAAFPLFPGLILSGERGAGDAAGVAILRTVWGGGAAAAVGCVRRGVRSVAEVEVEAEAESWEMSLSGMSVSREVVWSTFVEGGGRTRDIGAQTGYV